MNDLDKRIAGLKGLLNAEGQQVKFHGRLDADFGEPYWSTSDAKALELVDELRTEGMAFIMRSAEVGSGWLASFYPEMDTKFFQGGWHTRPGAICRAYIAAREWMATKAGDSAWKKAEEFRDRDMEDRLTRQAKEFEDKINRERFS